MALLAAGVAVLLFGGDDNSDDPEAAGLELTPEADLPGSVQEVVLGSLEDGPDRQLGEFLGTTPVVVNFFGSWCQPCLEEMPDFETVHQESGDQVTFIGLAENDTPDKALDTVARTGVTYPTFTDATGAALSYFQGLAMPTTVFIGADGEVLEVHSRKLSDDDLRDKLQELYGIGT